MVQLLVGERGPLDRLQVEDSIDLVVIGGATLARVVHLAASLTGASANGETAGPKPTKGS